MHPSKRSLLWVRSKIASASPADYSEFREELAPALLKVPAIIDKGMFDDIQAMLQKRDPKKGRARPSELIGARLDGRRLYIVSAKVSAANRRGLSDTRVIGLLDEFDKTELDELSQLLARLSDELVAVNGDRTRLVRRYADALRR